MDNIASRDGIAGRSWARATISLENRGFGFRRDPLATESLLADSFRQLADRGLTDLVIDARDVGFMDSTGVHAFLSGKKTIHEKGSRIFLFASPAVLRVLDLLVEGPVFAARFDTIDAALAALDGSE